MPIVYNKNNIYLTENHVKSMAFLFKNEKIKKLFNLDENKLEEYFKLYIIYTILINNNETYEKGLRESVDEQLKTVDFSFLKLKEEHGINYQILDIFLTANKFISLQLKQLAQMVKIQSPLYIQYNKHKFLSENRVETFVLIFNNQKKIVSSDTIPQKFHDILKKMKINEVINYENNKLKLKNKYYTHKRHTVYNFFYLVFKGIEEYELRSFIFGLMDFYSAKAIVNELKLHYDSKLIHNIPRTVFSSSQTDEDQNLLHALSYRQGKCFLHTNEDQVIVLIVDDVFEQDIQLVPEDVSSYKDLIVNGLTSRIIWI